MECRRVVFRSETLVAIPSSSPNLLIPSGRPLWEAGVDNCAHIRLVHTHPKRRCCHDYVNALRCPVFDNLVPLVPVGYLPREQSDALVLALDQAFIQLLPDRTSVV